MMRPATYGTGRATRARGRLVVAVTVVLTGALSTALGEPAAPCREVHVALDVRWDPTRAATVSGIVVRLGYPASLDVPVDAESGSARARVDNVTGMPGGLFDALTKDVDGDGEPDLLSVGLVTQGMKPGPFVRVTFACAPGASAPSPGDFTCTPDVADEAGHVPATCEVSVLGR